MKVTRNGETTDVSWVGFITMGMSNAQIQGAFIMAWRIGVVGYIVWSFGAFTSVGLPGVAFASDQKKIEAEIQQTQESIVESRLDVIDARIFDLRLLQCAAIDQGKSPLIYTIQMKEYLEKRSALTKEPISLPTCAELR